MPGQGQTPNVNQPQAGSTTQGSSGQGVYQGPQQAPGQQTTPPQQKGYVPPPPTTPGAGQPSPPPHISVPPPPVPEQGRDKSKTIILILALLTLIVAGFAGFYLGASGLINEKIAPTPTPTLTPAIVTFTIPTDIPIPTSTATPIPTPDPVINWKAYDLDKFSIKYPPYLPEPTIKKDESGEEINPATYESSFKEEGQEAVAYSVLFQVIGPEPNPDAMLLKQWLGENNRLDLGEEVDVEVTNVTVGGKEAILVSGFDKDSSVLISKRLYFELDDGIYSVGFNIEKTSARASEYGADFDRMLATFSFK